MKRFIIVSFLTLAAALSICAQNMIHEKALIGGHMREYYLYDPDNIAPGAPLVIMLHGYGGHAENYRPEMLEVARRYGFALCVPEGLAAPESSKQGWNVRYPQQEGMKVNDVAFLTALAKRLQKKYGYSPLNTFLCGMSNGGDIGYVVAWEEPGVFAAIASVAGLTFNWLIDESYPKGSVPFMEVHGTADHTSEWGGDPEGKGGWGAYASVPVGISYMIAADKCKAEQTYVLPLKDPAKPSRQVILHRYYEGIGGCEVRLYEVTGAPHSWHLADMDTCEEIWSFFSQYLIDETGERIESKAVPGYMRDYEGERGVIEETASAVPEKQVEPPVEPEMKAEVLPTESAAPSAVKADAVLEEARKYLGKSYRYAGTGPDSFDCSGFTSFIFKKFDISLPHSSSEQATKGTDVADKDIKPGDLVFFNGSRIGRGIGHVGIVTELKSDGSFKFIHAAIQGGVIISDSLEPYYASRYKGAKRVIN